VMWDMAVLLDDPERAGTRRKTGGHER